MRVLAWLLIAAGLTLAVASFIIAAKAPTFSPWPSLVVGLVLTVVGIVALESRPSSREPPDG